MINRAKRTMQHQLNTWIVTRFVDEIYNRNNLSNLPEFVADDCRYCREQTIIGENAHELRIHFAYTWINQQNVFEEVAYEIEEIITQNDIVSVRIRRIGKLKEKVNITPIVSRWEMFQLYAGKIVQRWLAKT